MERKPYKPKTYPFKNINRNYIAEKKKRLCYYR